MTFDNREYGKSKYNWPQTIFGGYINPLVGLGWRGNSIQVGATALRNFGSPACDMDFNFLFFYNYRDSRFNDGFVDEAVTVSRKDGRVELKPAEAPEWAWICFKAPMVVGLDEIDHGKPRDVLFCDFGSAGNTWNPKERYRVWLPKALDVHKKQ